MYQCYTAALKDASQPGKGTPVANLTLTIDDEVLKRARIRAIETDTSVNAVVRDFLERYAGDDRSEAALHRFADTAEAVAAGSQREGRSWTREELHDRARLR